MIIFWDLQAEEGSYLGEERNGAAAFNRQLFIHISTFLFMALLNFNLNILIGLSYKIISEFMVISIWRGSIEVGFLEWCFPKILLEHFGVVFLAILLRTGLKKMRGSTIKIFWFFLRLFFLSNLTKSLFIWLAGLNLRSLIKQWKLTKSEDRVKTWF